MKYETVIGLEVHAQLLTKSKMYCACSTDYASAPPNTHVCPVCMGMPGVLPVINKQAVEYTMMTALALHCSISELTKFDRKNYPYPDLMKGYQISQFDQPVGLKGYLTIDIDGETRKIGVTRVHLEEDVAKLQHRASGGEDYSLVDVNRAGCPLMEIVGEPDLRSPEEAEKYLRKLHSILRNIRVSSANMEEGSFRCDANISIRPEGSKELGSKVEVKNMNSFKAVRLAMEYEEKRQRKAADEGKRLVQETRGWLDEEGKTVSQRSKEYAHDYRYFPEPDLPPIIIGRDWVESIKAILPELPEAKRDRFISEYNMTPYNAELLSSSWEMSASGDALVTEFGIDPNTASNWLLGEVSHIINENNIDMSEFMQRVSTNNLAQLIRLNEQNVINTASAKIILGDMYNTGEDASKIIKDKGLSQISDTDELEKIAAEVIQSNVQPVADYKAGKEAALKFLVGQVMKASKGRANPQVVNEVLKKKLAETQ